MKTRLIVTLFLLTLALSLSAQDATNRLRFPATGFSIAPLEASPGDEARKALMMFLPASENFAANVNVLIQPYSGTIEEYTKVTLDAYKANGMKVLQQKEISRSVVVFEVTGEMDGRTLHWYSRAEKVAGRIYLATGTAREEDWPRQGAPIKNCVDSLRCEKTEPGSAPGK